MMIQNSIAKPNIEVPKTDVKHNDEHKEEHKEMIDKDNDLKVLSMLAGISLIPMDTASEIKELHHCVHELDKRVCVIEKLVEYIMKKGL